MEKKNIIVIDIDGTMADINHRLHLIKCDKPNYDEFFNECQNDLVNEWCRSISNTFLAAGFTVFLVSARPKRVEPRTRNWLNQNGVLYTELFCLREDTDSTQDHLLKSEWLVPWKDRVLFVVDDRQRVVDMWRKEGLTCLQCEAWKEWKKT